MTDDIPTQWLVGMLIVPGLAWSIAVMWLLRDIKKGNDELIRIHTPQHADESGFGTVALKRDMQGTHRCLRELVHYARERKAPEEKPYVEGLGPQ